MAARTAVAGHGAQDRLRHNRFVTLTNATKTVNRELEAKARALAGIKGYVTNIADPTPKQVIAAYRTIQIQAGEHAITAADPLPDDVHQILQAIKTRAATH